MKINLSKGKEQNYILNKTIPELRIKITNPQNLVVIKPEKK